MKNELASVWFFNQGWQPHPFQEACWQAIAKGQSGILNAPTGYGKTFAIWFGLIQQYYTAAYQEKLAKQRKKGSTPYGLRRCGRPKKYIG